EHPSEAGDAVGPVLFVSVEDGFGITVSLVSVTGALQFQTKIGVIKELTVIGHPEFTGLISHRLAASGNINNAEAAVPELRENIAIEAAAIRPTVMDSVGHAGQHGVRPSRGY